MNPLLFPVFVHERRMWIAHRLTWFGEWIDGTPTHASQATVVGGITFAALAAIAVIAYLSRAKLMPVGLWMKRSPILWTTAGAIIGTPLFAFILICLNKYLTFASALAATVGVLVALDNNRRSHTREENRFKRQGIAARAALVLELSSVSNYCAVVAKELKAVTYPDANRMILENKFTPPPASAAATFKEMITSTDLESVTKRCSQLLSFIQLVESNLRSIKLTSKGAFVVDRHMCLFNIARLRAASDSLFPFSRKNDSEIKRINWIDIDRIIELFGLHEDVPFKEFLDPVKAQFPEGPMNVTIIPYMITFKPVLFR